MYRAATCPGDEEGPFWLLNFLWSGGSSGISSSSFCCFFFLLYHHHCSGSISCTNYMESLPEQKLDLINVAIQRLMEEKKSGHDKDPFIGTESEDHHLRLLSELLSQLESLKGDAATDPPVESSPKTRETNSMASALVVSAENSGETPEGTRSIGTDEIVKELKEVKKQNRITHWLLSIMIVLTVTWQVSEVSLLLKLKDGLSHPFRSVGSMLTGMFKGRRDGEDSPIPNPSDMLPIPPVKIPELPKIDVTDLSLKGEENN